MMCFHEFMCCSILQYSLWGGSSHRFEGGTIFEIDVIENHPSYDERTIRFDVCVLRTKDPMIGSAIRPIPLVSVDEDYAPLTPAVVTGWGLTVCSDFYLVFRGTNFNLHIFRVLLARWLLYCRRLMYHL